MGPRLTNLVMPLAFNMIGYITLAEREDYNIVSIDFHDRSSHAAMRFNDSIKYSMAALGASLAVFVITLP